MTKYTKHEQGIRKQAKAILRYVDHLEGPNPSGHDYLQSIKESIVWIEFYITEIRKQNGVTYHA